MPLQVWFSVAVIWGLALIGMVLSRTIKSRTLVAGRLRIGASAISLALQVLALMAVTVLLYTANLHVWALGILMAWCAALIIYCAIYIFAHRSRLRSRL